MEQVIRMYTKQILLGLEYLHKNGIMHMDIKISVPPRKLMIILYHLSILIRNVDVVDNKKKFGPI